MNVRALALTSAMINGAGAAWESDQRAQGLSKRTISERTRIIARVSTSTGEHPERFTREGLVGYLETPEFSPATRATYWAALRAWSAWLVLMGVRPDDPTATMRKPKVPRRMPHPITTAELERLLAARMWHSTRAAIMLGAYAGLRVHEIAQVRGEDVHGDQLRVQGKGGVVSWIPLNEQLQKLAERMPKVGWWFPSPADARFPVDRASVSTGISRVMRRAGVSGSAHSLRHWYGTELVRAGVDLRTVQELMRHSSLATTAIYTAVDDGQRRAGVARLPGAMVAA